MALKVKSLKLKNRNFGSEWQDVTEDRWNYEDFLQDDRWRKDWISFDCLCYVPPVDTVYVGITSFNADIFWGWNRSKQEWVSTGYERVADPFDAKFHRSLMYYGGHLWGACALLHDIDNYWDAPGSPIIKYDPKTNEIARVATPLPHHYIQATCLDAQRQIMYCQTFTPERLVSYDLNTGESKDLGLTGSGLHMGQGENIVLDDNNCVWGSWSLTRAWQSAPGVDKFRLYRYSPETGKINFLKTGLPNPDGSYGTTKLEALFNFGTGCLYASGGNGSLYRIDIDTGKAKYLGTPIPDRRSRLASMAIGPDGCAYGVTGRDGQCELLRLDPKTEEYELLGDIVDEDGVHCWQIHDVEITPDGKLYAGENDVVHRSGYLWEINIGC